MEVQQRQRRFLSLTTVDSQDSKQGQKIFKNIFIWQFAKLLVFIVHFVLLLCRFAQWMCFMVRFQNI